MWRLRRAYKLVLKDLSDISLFRGVYDAVHGDEHFMYGIQTVMETVAFVANDLEFIDTFIDNMTYSQEEAGAGNEQEPRQGV